MAKPSDRLADLIIDWIDDHTDASVTRGRMDAWLNEAYDRVEAYMDRSIPDDVKHLAPADHPTLTAAERNAGAVI